MAESTQANTSLDGQRSEGKPKDPKSGRPSVRQAAHPKGARGVRQLQKRKSRKMTARPRREVKSEEKEKAGLATEAPAEEAKPSTEKLQPLPYHTYQPVKESKVTDYPVHFWFYVYVYSSEIDRQMAPFLQLDKRFPSDRRLMAIMNKTGVQIRLGPLEFYKSLPRRIIILHGRASDSIVRAVFEMETMFPVLMRYACYPILMDGLTLQFNCTSALQTAGIVRLT